MMTDIFIEQIRHELTWRLRQQELYPDGVLSEMSLPEDVDGTHYGAFHEGWLVGVVSVFNHNGDVQFRKLAVDQKHQHKGIGTILLQYITRCCIEEGAKRLWCNARKTAEGFYMKAGFIATGQEFSKNGIDYVIMEKHLIHDSQ